MKVTSKTIKELIDDDSDCPLPISAIPNSMGINLCSVEGITWTRLDDGQVLNLTINFSPDFSKVESTERKQECADR